MLKLKIVTQWNFLLTEMLNLLATYSIWNFVLPVLLIFFSLQIGVLMSELNNIWRDVQRGPPDPFLVIGYQINFH